jgi:hypothetical protein
MLKRLPNSWSGSDAGSNDWLDARPCTRSCAELDVSDATSASANKAMTDDRIFVTVKGS